ncbi:hypothetical protein ACFY4C_20855 [Actinomadura viridis]|uniref:hypothetical protein n=1 Tax=Actinomadura viridis TaxID=58110 RepID=UPI00367EBC19
MTSPTPLTPQTMERLAFIRLLHQQGVEQSRLPEPISFACVLTFHDAIELFLLLSAERLNAKPSDRKSFTDKYYSAINQALPAGTNLDGEQGVRRITDARNGFKHANNWPSTKGIQQYREDTVLFFQANTPKVFGIAYDGIDMADLVPQDTVRDRIKQAAQVGDAGNRPKAMGLLVAAFDLLFEEHLGLQRYEQSPFSFGRTIRPSLRETEIRTVFTEPRGHTHRGPNNTPTPIHNFSSTPDRLARQIETITAAAISMQRAMRVTAIGIDYHQYERFTRLTPAVQHEESGEIRVFAVRDYAPNEEEFDYCHRFVITVALRLAGIQAHTLRPSWIAHAADEAHSLAAGQHVEFT